MIFLQRSKDIVEFPSIIGSMYSCVNIPETYYNTTISAKTGMVGLLVIEFFCIRSIKRIYNKKTQGSFLTKVLFNGRGILERKLRHFKIKVA